MLEEEPRYFRLGALFSSQISSFTVCYYVREQAMLTLLENMIFLGCLIHPAAHHLTSNSLLAESYRRNSHEFHFGVFSGFCDTKAVMAIDTKRGASILTTKLELPYFQQCKRCISMIELRCLQHQILTFNILSNCTRNQPISRRPSNESALVETVSFSHILPGGLWTSITRILRQTPMTKPGRRKRDLQITEAIRATSWATTRRIEGRKDFTNVWKKGQTRYAILMNPSAKVFTIGSADQLINQIQVTMGLETASWNGSNVSKCIWSPYFSNYQTSFSSWISFLPCNWHAALPAYTNNQPCIF